MLKHMLLRTFAPMLFLVLTLFSSFSLRSPSAIAQDEKQITTQLERFLGDDASVQIFSGYEPLRDKAALERFYVGRGFSPVWLDIAGMAMLTDLLDTISRMSEHGLTPDDYHRRALEKAFANGDFMAMELLATDAYLAMAAHLIGGRLDPITIETNWTAMRRERDLTIHLEKAISEQNIAESLSELEPDAPGYGVLKHALAMFRKADKDGGWLPIPEGPALKLGEQGPRVVNLRARLLSTGLLDVSETVSDLFDSDVETAVAAFQRRIGLEVDGVVGTETLRELNKSPSQRIDQIRANLERWRWLPENLGYRHICVNIADFRLEAQRGDTVERVHDVIVGRPYRMTPVFSGEISYVVLNPHWDAPAKIARLDKLPLFQKNPDAVTHLGFQVFDRSGKTVDPREINWNSYTAKDFPFHLRQRPGPQNALGVVKIMFPNRHDVYLHDTPSRELFERTERAFSSGCVRVADAVGLTEWVLDETPGWSRTEIEKAISEKHERRVDLSKKIPVHILYFTAVSEPDGSLRLINDIYGRDARLIAALNGSSLVSKR